MSSSIESKNPFNDEVLARVPIHNEAEVDARLDALAGGVGRDSLEERAAALVRLAKVLDARREELALMATREMGKPISQALAEIDKCGSLCRHYAENARDYCAPEPLPKYDGGTAEVALRPLGAILGVMPWNYPFWQALRFIVPTLLAGNTVALRHASNVPQCAREIEGVLREAGLGPDIFSTLFVETGRIAGLIEDDRIAGVSLTGGERAGRAIGKVAGEALKPTILELGGSDPYVVLDDADVERAARTGVQARFQNCGQTCIAAKRFIVDRSVGEHFVERFVAAAEELVVGDPEKAETAIGPLANGGGADEVEEAVRDALDLGARLALGEGKRRDGSCVVPPSVLVDVDPRMVVAKDEVFGPLAVIRIVDGEEEAVAVANETAFGLGASVWSGDGERARLVAARIQSGVVFINGLVQSHPAVPFGGVKISGLGRELGREGVRAFANLQSIVEPESGE